MLTGGSKREHIGANPQGVQMSVSTQKQKNEEFEFSQNMADVWRVLPHGDYDRALAVINAIKERLETMDYSKYVRHAPEGQPPLRRII